MIEINEFFTVDRIQCESAPAPTENLPGRIAIRTTLHCLAKIKVLFMISLELDGIQLIESSRLVVNRDDRTARLPEMYVVNPLRKNADGYTVTLHIYAGYGKEYQLSEKIYFE